jgi:hypothetical protein
MRTLSTLVALGLLAIGIGCGGSSDSSDSGALAGNGGGGLGGGGAGGGGGGAGTCNFPSCFAAIATDCIPSGTCVKSTGTAGSSNICYSNGVKEISALSISGTTISYVVTFKNASKTCYSMIIDPSAALSGGPVTMSINDPAGTTVGTMSVDTATGQGTVTCTNQAPVTLESACTAGLDPTGTTAGSTPCTEGACTP